MQRDIPLQQLTDRRAKLFEGIARFAIRFRYMISVGMMLLAILLGMQLKHFTVDTTSEGLLHEDDPKRIAFDQFRDQFGSSEAIIAAIGPVDVFSQDLLKRLKEFHEALEVSVPHIDDITSLINARNTRGGRWRVNR